MKRLLFPILLLAILATGCKPQNEPENPTPEPEPVEQKPVARFTAKVGQPLKVYLTNNSSYADSYKWSFGDLGKFFYDRDFDEYDYMSIGVYKITLVAINEYGTDTATTVVKVEMPTECYYTGFKFNSIPLNNKYYRVELYDETAKSLVSYTDDILLSSANLPYSGKFTTTRKIDYFKTHTYSYIVKYGSEKGGSRTKVATIPLVIGEWPFGVDFAILDKYAEPILEYK